MSIICSQFLCNW